MRVMRVLLVVLALGAPLRGEGVREEMPFPFQIVSVDSNDGVVFVEHVANPFETLRRSGRIALAGVPLPTGGDVTLNLARRDVFANGAVIESEGMHGIQQLPLPDVLFLGGTVAGDPESIAFLSISPSKINGIIETQGHAYIVSSGPHGQGLKTAISSAQSLVAANMDSAGCGEQRLTEGGWNPDDYLPRASGESARGGATPVRTVRVAIETDWEFTGSLFGGDTDESSAYAATIVGAVSEIYMRDVSALLRISYLRVWSDSGDPWSGTNTDTQLTQFRSYWNSNMTHVSRDATHFFSARSLGGGLAYGGVLCSTGWNYAISANLSSSFPYPLRDNNFANWVPYVVAHEFGHNFGAPHTHSASPPIDGCGFGDCSVVPNGTIMSYCHGCAGGISNIVLRFDDRMVSQYMLPYLTNGSSCGFEPDPPIVAGLMTNRYLLFESGNAGLVSAIRVELTASDDFSGSIGEFWWVGAPDENGVSQLQAAPHYRDWGEDSILVSGCAVVPAAEYEATMIGEGWDTGSAASYSSAAALATSLRPTPQFWADAVGVFNGSEWTPGNGVVNFNDIDAAVAAFQDLESAPSIMEMDMHPEVTNFHVNFADIDLIIKAFQAFPYPYSAPIDCP